MAIIRIDITNERLRNELRATDSIDVKNGITKEYISNEKRIIISDTTKTLLNLKLESDYKVAVISKPDALIAWFLLKDFSGETLVDNIKFYDVNDNYKELNKNYTFKYETKGNVSVYNESKKEAETVKGDIWVVFNSLSELPSKNVKIGLFTDISLGDKIEWIIEKNGFDIQEWAVVSGTNAGFVTVAPSADPEGAAALITGDGVVTKDTSPATAVKITEIGWYKNNATTSSNFEVGLYAADGVVVPGEAGTLLEVSRTQATGAGAGWKTVVVDWTIEPDTDYWFGVQLDGSGAIDRNLSGGFGRDFRGSIPTLPNPWGGGALSDADAIEAIYVVWSAGAETKTKTFTADALLQASQTKTFTADSILVNQITKTFTADAFLQASLTKTFTVDAFLQASLTKTFTVDAFLQASQTKTFTADAILKASLTKTFTVDAILEGASTKTFTIDAILKASDQTKTFTVDALLQDSFTKTFTANALLQASQTKTFTTDAILKASQTKTFTADAMLQASQTKAFTADAMLQALQTQTFTADAFLQASQTKTFTVDALLVVVKTKTFTANALLKGSQTKTFSTNALLQQSFTKTFTADAILSQPTTSPSKDAFTGTGKELAADWPASGTSIGIQGDVTEQSIQTSSSGAILIGFSPTDRELTGQFG